MYDIKHAPGFSHLGFVYEGEIYIVTNYVSVRTGHPFVQHVAGKTRSGILARYNLPKPVYQAAMSWRASGFYRSMPICEYLVKMFGGQTDASKRD